MRNADRLRIAMRPGRVYRRQDLGEYTSAVDRDLKILVHQGMVKKLAAGLYYRPRKNVFGFTPPDDHDLVRAFLKTEDFLLTSYTNYNLLGLGLTQVYSSYIVYNHKRVGEFSLGRKHFKFRRVPAYPKKLSREFLLVDLLNNLEHVPDDAGLVLKNLKARIDTFDRDELLQSLERYGRPVALRIISESHA